MRSHDDEGAGWDVVDDGEAVETGEVLLTGREVEVLERRAKGARDTAYLDATDAERRRRRTEMLGPDERGL